MHSIGFDKFSHFIAIVTYLCTCTSKLEKPVQSLCILRFLSSVYNFNFSRHYSHHSDFCLSNDCFHPSSFYFRRHYFHYFDFCLSKWVFSPVHLLFPQALCSPFRLLFKQMLVLGFFHPYNFYRFVMTKVLRRNVLRQNVLAKLHCIDQNSLLLWIFDVVHVTN